MQQPQFKCDVCLKWRVITEFHTNKKTGFKVCDTCYFDQCSFCGAQIPVERMIYVDGWKICSSPCLDKSIGLFSLKKS